MANTTDIANVIIRPPIAWAVVVLAGLAPSRLVPLPFVERKFGDVYSCYRAHVRRWL
ncbi:hypothetical protein PPGU19_025300 [Paraburkholderia sp. PGU19]|uniref:hypothetical protein n=1 Tax=Paraburkholderia sp. PGU19 TaxID=2735434 RepID=UPI0015DB1C19|nr:hypothetical protein [Paraburkholderia sp. PGU19]BCF97961.1 hypothetical protein PPGU19_025300 [Paraburkholderia sp. PGU19]